MHYITVDFDPVWMSHNKPVKIWATSKRTYNAKINFAKSDYNYLCSSEIPINLSEIDYVEITPKCIRFYFKIEVADKVFHWESEDSFISVIGNHIVFEKR